MGTEWVAPSITGLFALIVGIVGGILARRGKRLEAKESRAPDVEMLWAQQESDRRARQSAEDLWWNLRRAFQSFYRRVQHHIGLLVAAGLLTEVQASHFELTDKEKAAIDARPSED